VPPEVRAGVAPASAAAHELARCRARGCDRPLACPPTTICSPPANIRRHGSPTTPPPTTSSPQRHPLSPTFSLPALRTNAFVERGDATCIGTLYHRLHCLLEGIPAMHISPPPVGLSLIVLLVKCTCGTHMFSKNINKNYIFILRTRVIHSNEIQKSWLLRHIFLVHMNKKY
jgi:hypothetical protein